VPDPDFFTHIPDRERVLTKLRDLLDSAKTETVQLGAAIALGKTAALFTDVTRDDSDQDFDLEAIDKESIGKTNAILPAPRIY
jgi:hypothetical protein